MLTDRFNDKSNGKVYHCIPVTPEGDAIRPSLGYGTEISASVRQALNIDPLEKVPLVFAATHFSKSLAFGFQVHTGEVLFNASVEEAGVELTVVGNREETMSRARDITVYEISNEKFVEIFEGADQSVSKEAVKFSDAKVVFKAHNAYDLMKEGLQVFSYHGNREETMSEFCNLMKRGTFYSAMSAFVKSGKLIWENNESNLNANPILAKMIDIPLKKSKDLQTQSHFKK